MPTRRNALLVFSKPPIPGLVKTRLSTQKDGWYSLEIAAWLYNCMFFDVLEITCDALTDLEAKQAAENRPGDPTDVYDIFISTTPAENVAVMEKCLADSGQWPRRFTVIHDTGASFDEHYNDAFEQVFSLGYDTILSYGADMPALTKSVIIEGLEKLQRLSETEKGGFVLSPDQQMGVSLVGWTKDAHMDHTGVFYNVDGLTVLPAYIQKAEARGVPTFYLPAVPDVDTILDLLHAVTLMEAMEYCSRYESLTVPWRTLGAVRELNIQVLVPPNELRDSREGIDT
ncbi:MAG: DUF2064 domain-containing protein [Coriobacteriia bacterium]|nr:DUF2064 domain-containing protein [Coriobacteriia bacterium]